jgi:DNA invertase Pin-like site-specific DNA recombinase
LVVEGSIVNYNRGSKAGYNLHAEAEHLRILERTNEGRLNAKLKGIKFGRQRKIDRDKLLEYKAQGIIGTALAKKMGISRSMVYKILKEENSNYF